MNLSLPLDKMTVEEKLRLIEQIWEDLRKNEEQSAVPDWHLAILRERGDMVAGGKAEFVDLDTFKKLVDAEIARGRPR